MISCLSDSRLPVPLVAAVWFLAVVSGAFAETPASAGRFLGADVAPGDESLVPAVEVVEEDSWRLGLSFGSMYRYGPIRGYVQTPLGGTLGSTGLHRPTLKELDFDHARGGRFLLSTAIGSHTVYFGADPLELSGTTVLSRTLTTHGLVFPAGTGVRTSIQFNLYRIGYQYRIGLGREKPCAFEIAPVAEVAALDFRYRLRPVAGGAYASRTYREHTPRLGIEAKWFATDDLTVSGRVVGSIPIEDTINVWTAGVRVDYVLWRGDMVKVTACGGVEFEYVDYEDSQPLSNHIRMEFGPAVVLSLRVTF